MGSFIDILWVITKFCLVMYLVQQAVLFAAKIVYDLMGYSDE